VVITNTDIRDGQPSHVGDRKAFEVMTSTWPLGTLGSVTSLLAATLYQGDLDRNHKLWNIVSNICVTNDHRSVPFVVNTILPFPHSWLTTRYLTRVTWQVLLVVQELLTIPEFTPVFCVVHVAQLLVFCEVFCRSFCLFFLFSIITLTGLHRK
jgi:hypothetical protein